MKTGAEKVVFAESVKNWIQTKVAYHKFLRGGVVIIDAIPKRSVTFPLGNVELPWIINPIFRIAPLERFFAESSGRRQKRNLLAEILRTIMSR